MVNPSDSLLHPRLLGPEAAQVALAGWEGAAHVVREAAAPGALAALAMVARRMPLEVRWYGAQLDQSWSGDIQLSDEPDPQMAPALFLARSFAQDELAEWLRSGGIPAAPCPDPLHLWAWHKGAFVEAGATLAPAGGVDAWLALDDTGWPADWGGELRVNDAPLALRRGDLLLLRAGAGFTLSLLRAHVEAHFVRCWFPVEAP